MRRRLTWALLILVALVGVDTVLGRRAVQVFGGGGGYVWWPQHPEALSITSSVNWAIDAAGERSAWRFYVNKTGTIDKVHVMAGAVSSAQDVRFSLQNVDLATGFPDGTQDQYRDVAAGSISASTVVSTGLVTDDGTDGGAKRSVTRGDLLALVVEFTGSTGNIRWGFTGSGGDNWHGHSMLTQNYNGSAWSIQSVVAPVLVLEYSDGSFVSPIGAVPATGLTTNTAFDSTDSPDEIGLAVTPTVPMRVMGVWARLDLQNASPTDTQIKAYDSDGSSALVPTITVDKDTAAGGAAAYGVWILSSPADLSVSGTFRFTIVPGTGPISYTEWTTTAGHGEALRGGSSVVKTERTDGGAWSQTDDVLPHMGLILEGFDDAVGGGGGGGSFPFIGGLLDWFMRPDMR